MNQGNISALTEEEITFLTIIINRGIKEVKPIIGKEGIQYEPLDDILKENNYAWDNIYDLLKAIAKKGGINKKGHEKLVLCPKCGSPHVYTKYSCPKCESTDISNMRLVEHPFCGYTGTLDSFRKGSNLVCPRCDNILGSRASDANTKKGGLRRRDYKLIGSTFECDKCGWKSDRPNIVHNCTECALSFTYRNSNYERIFSYEIPENIIEELRTSKEIAILMVEDNDDDAEILQIHLKKHKNFNVSRVSRGDEGLKILGENIFDIILLDYGLPDMNGIDFLKKMRENGIISPVIFFTGRDDRNSAVESMKLGASDYLIKSVEEYEKVASTIKQIVNRKFQ
jgi:CheY-like chemotaxis protein/predicted Zn-ribbon and HTH transcriptional regulator